MSVLQKIVSREELLARAKERRAAGQRMAFTNGCFDLLHVGHARYLEAARREADYLVVAINSDASVARIKDPRRPILPEDQRARVLAGLRSVDFVTVFDEDDPIALLRQLRPEILVKGANYAIEGVVGREAVWEYGGEVKTLALTHGASTTHIVERILAKNRP
ncbi:MAG: Bifunctional protein HldE [candidate division BRC1 bacterium ADurb.BinA364]|nr:MAG: Bifunctional protein HldE [candidate division BRC1 bacterium ADurb.BinA364]